MQDSSARSVSGPDASSSSSTCNTEPFSLYGDIDGLEPVNQNAEENTESSSRLIIAADDTEQLLVSAEPMPCPEAENLADGMETSTVATSQNPTQHEQPSDPMSQSQDLEHQNQDGPADGREDHRMIHRKDGTAHSLCDAFSPPTSQNATVKNVTSPTASETRSQNPTPKPDHMLNDEVSMPPTRPSISLPENIAVTPDGKAPYLDPWHDPQPRQRGRHASASASFRKPPHRSEPPPTGQISDQHHQRMAAAAVTQAHAD